MLQGLDELVGVLHQRGFSHLQLQANGVQARVLQRLGNQRFQIATPKLHGRQVHRNGQPLGPSVVPGAHLAAGFAHDPLAYVHNQARLFCGSNELQGRYQAQARAVPAHQGLGAYQGATGQVNDRLVVQHKLLLRNGQAQVREQVQVLLDVGVEFVIKKPVGVAARGLGLVHSQVGMAQQLFKVRAVARVHGNADGARREYF